MEDKGFEHFQINPVADERGKIYNWYLPDGRQITIYERKKGVRCGGHFHTGKDASKDPERLFLAQGKIRVRFVVPDTGKKTAVVLKAGDNLIIRPFVRHYLTVLEDALLVEYRLTHFDKHNSDTVSCRR